MSWRKLLKISAKDVHKKFLWCWTPTVFFNAELATSVGKLTDVEILAGILGEPLKSKPMIRWRVTMSHQYARQVYKWKKQPMSLNNLVSFLKTEMQK